MNNRIRVSLVFSFKGETHAPSAVIDLDALADRDEVPDFQALLARQAGIDTYSYAYEVMQQAELAFSDPTGLAAEHLHDGQFDVAGFLAAVREQRIVDQLQAIAANTLDVDDLSIQPALRQALLAAYRLGKQA